VRVERVRVRVRVEGVCVRVDAVQFILILLGQAKGENYPCVDEISAQHLFLQEKDAVLFSPKGGSSRYKHDQASKR